MQKKVSDYLLRMIDEYLSDRWVIYEGDKWSLTEEMTCGAPQGSRVGPLVWNVMYDDSLRLDLPDLSDHNSQGHPMWSKLDSAHA